MFNLGRLSEESAVVAWFLRLVPVVGEVDAMGRLDGLGDDDGLGTDFVVFGVLTLRDVAGEGVTGEGDCEVEVSLS